MEIERNVPIESGRNLQNERKAGFSSGPHTTNVLPEYSENELKVGLGIRSGEIQTFVNTLIASHLAAPASPKETPEPEDPAKEPDASATQSPERDSNS